MTFTGPWRGWARNSAKAQGALVARCVKDVIEEKLFARRQDLFTDLSLVFMDTTSLSFHGAGGRRWGSVGIPRTSAPIWRK
ncbi:hypothetical protein [Mesorhizobium sp. SARCC-RB16n]|uniref:hypothetical protein n=1 Tax=Mesorhizobium sp. SARCC-RB16n TaxID=2116687 RepID=UPI001AED83A7|nr:hypothetical protein [Mesorhizobium sp. SARCC-RB16n]